MSNFLLPLFLKYYKNSVKRDFIIDYFVVSEYMTLEETIRTEMIHTGKIFTKDNKFYVITEVEDNQILSYEEIPAITKPLSFYNRFELKKGIIDNYSSDQTVLTTCGTFIVNYVLFVHQFGNLIPYVNDLINLSKIESNFIAPLRIQNKISSENYYRYVDQTVYISSLSGFVNPGITDKSLRPSKRALELRDRLIKENKELITKDPSVMVKIEEQVTKVDKEDLKGDDSNGFLLKGKNYDVQRKKMFYFGGMTTNFGSEEVSHVFVQTALDAGWQIDEMPAIANSVRHGAAGRAKDTALGGDQSNKLASNFQDYSITTNDCLTTDGIKEILTEDNFNHYIDHYYITSNGSLDIINKDNKDKLLGKKLTIRSAMFCKAEGYCFKCMGKRIEQLDSKVLGTYPISIGSAFVSSKMATFHGTKVEILDISDFDQFLI